MKFCDCPCCYDNGDSVVKFIPLTFTRVHSFVKMHGIDPGQYIVKNGEEKSKKRKQTPIHNQA